MTARAGIALMAMVLAVGGCRRTEGKATPIGTATGTATATPTGTATAIPTTTAIPARGCESFAQRGEVRIRVAGGEGSAPMARGDVIPNGAVVEVADGAELTLRTAMYREITLVGPATAAACRDGEDGILLLQGKMSAAPGTGVRPGVDVWVATPLGVVRYTDARIEVEASADGSRVAANAISGQADFLPAPGTHVEVGSQDAHGKPLVEVPVRVGSSFVATRTAGPLPRFFSDLVRACEAESAATAEALRRLSEADAGELGERASRHVQARRRARAACETARAALYLGPGTVDASLAAQLDAADEKRNRLTPLPARR